MVVHLTGLPKILLASVLDVTSRGNLCKLIADDKIHIQSPIQFKRASCFLSFLEVLEDGRHKFVFNLFHIFSLSVFLLSK